MLKETRNEAYCKASPPIGQAARRWRHIAQWRHSHHATQGRQVITETVIYGLMVAVMLLVSLHPAIAMVLAGCWVSGQIGYWSNDMAVWPVIDLGCLMLVSAIYVQAPSRSIMVVLCCYLCMLYVHTISGELGYEIYARTLNALFVTQLFAAGWSGGRGIGRSLFHIWDDFLLHRLRRASTL